MTLPGQRAADLAHRACQLLAELLALSLDQVGPVALHVVGAHLVFEEHDLPPRLAEGRRGRRLIVVDRNNGGNNAVTLGHNKLAFLQLYIRCRRSPRYVLVTLLNLTLLRRCSKARRALTAERRAAHLL